MSESIQLRTSDDFSISATLFQGGKKGQHAVIIAPATAVTQDYYRPFAEYACGYDQFDVLTFDYRGTGQSIDRPLASFHATMSDWGRYDLDAAISWASSRYDKVFLLGHSVAGQIYPKAAHRGRITAAYFVASQSAYWGAWRGVQKAKVWFFWNVVLPLCTWHFDYLPDWALGGRVALPAGVAWEWQKWGLHKNGVALDDPETKQQFAELRIPIHFVAFDDDKLLAPAKATQKLMTLYKNSKTTFQYVRAADIGRGNVGHFGFFRAENKTHLWPLPIMNFTQYIRQLGEE